MKKSYINLSLILLICLSGAASGLAQKDSSSKVNRKSEHKTTDSIGGKEHNAEMLGVKIGMDVPTALEAVFVNANRRTGQEKPDSKRNEGKDKKDVRVIYKDLPQGELQIVFADGIFVREIMLKYTKPPAIDDLRLPYTGYIGDALVVSSNRPDSAINAVDVGNTTRERGESYDGTRFDDRYSIGFTNAQKTQRIWWRDEEKPEGYRVRLQFISSDKFKDAGAKFVVVAIQKLLFVTPGDEAKFKKSLALNSK